MPPIPADAAVIAATQRWLERAVIGLNLCPFAKAVVRKGALRTVVSAADDTAALLDDLDRELLHLRDTPLAVVETTLLIAPRLFPGFAEFADFLDLAEVSLRVHGLGGTLQIAHFHPHYEFADADGADDAANFTNRAPWPTLHLLREASIARAVAAFPEADAIYARNIALARALGAAGWQRLLADPDPSCSRTDLP